MSATISIVKIPICQGWGGHGNTHPFTNTGAEGLKLPADSPPRLDALRNKLQIFRRSFLTVENFSNLLLRYTIEKQHTNSKPIIP